MRFLVLLSLYNLWNHLLLVFYFHLDLLPYGMTSECFLWFKTPRFLFLEWIHWGSNTSKVNSLYLTCFNIENTQTIPWMNLNNFTLFTYKIMEYLEWFLSSLILLCLSLSILPNTYSLYLSLSLRISKLIVPLLLPN